MFISHYVNEFYYNVTWFTELIFTDINYFFVIKIKT